MPWKRAVAEGILIPVLVGGFCATARGEEAVPTGEFRQDVEGRRTFVTEHFNVSYDRLGASLASIEQMKNPAYVRDLGLELERIWKWYKVKDFRVPSMQFVRLVPIHMTRNWLDGVKSEVGGEAVPFAAMLHIGCHDAGGKLIPVEKLRTTLAHEYFHRIQQQYQVFVTADIYLREGSANLMEVLVYPNQAEDTVRGSGNMTPVRFDSVSLYDQADSAMAFFLFLSQKYGVTLFRDIYEAYGGPLNTFQTTWGAIEKAVEAREAGAGKMSALFLEFADDFFTTNPPKHALYPVLRTDRRDANPLAKPHDLGTGQKSTVQFKNEKPFTADYVVCRSSKLVRVTAELVTSQGRAHVRLYQVGRDQTTYSCYLSKSQPKASDAITVGPNTGIGLLFTNVGNDVSEGTVELTMEEVKTGWIRQEPTLLIHPDDVPVGRNPYISWDSAGSSLTLRESVSRYSNRKGAFSVSTTCSCQLPPSLVPGQKFRIKVDCQSSPAQSPDEWYVPNVDLELPWDNLNGDIHAAVFHNVDGEHGGSDAANHDRMRLEAISKIPDGKRTLEGNWVFGQFVGTHLGPQGGPNGWITEYKDPSGTRPPNITMVMYLSAGPPYGDFASLTWRYTTSQQQQRPVAADRSSIDATPAQPQIGTR